MEKKLLKVCGLTQFENIQEILRLGVTHIGFIFYKPSPRYLGEKLQPQAANALHNIQKVGVFVNAEKSYILDCAATYGLDLVQLHGQESPAFCKDIQTHLPVIKAFNIRVEEDLRSTEDYAAFCRYFLFDAAGESHGGNGVRFNWDLLENYTGKTPFFLSGGIGLEETEHLRRFSHPAWKGIDINSKFEIRPGEKDTAAIQQFIQNIPTLI